MSERDAERRQRRRQPIRDRQGMEVALGRERVDRDLPAGDVLLDEQGRTPRCIEGDANGLGDFLGRAHERQAALPLPVGRLHDAGEADPLRRLRRFRRTRADLESGLRHACLVEPLALAQLGRG